MAWYEPANPVQNIPVAAEADWWRAGAYLGLTASTGDLADNHDALSLLVSSDGACVCVCVCGRHCRG